jgi:chlorite dismutase
MMDLYEINVIDVDKIADFVKMLAELRYKEDKKWIDSETIYKNMLEKVNSLPKPTGGQ